MIADVELKARLEYGRLLWKKERNRARLLHHWLDPRHHWANRFQEHQSDVDELLSRDSKDDEQYEKYLHEKGLSIRVVAKEIPPVIGSFY